MNIKNEILRLENELADLDKRLLEIQTDIYTERNSGNPIGSLRLVEANLIAQVESKKAEKLKLKSMPPVVVITPLESNQVVFSTSSVREKLNEEIV